MQRNPFQTLLGKAAQGDEPSLRKVTDKLCDRLVFVPVAHKQVEGGNQVRVSVIRVLEGNRKIIPVFLTQQTLKRWMDLSNLRGEGLGLYCSDICKAVGLGHWLMVDPGTDYWLELEPGYTDRIAQYEPEEEDDFMNDEPVLQQPPAPQRPEPQRQAGVVPEKPKEPILNLTQEVPIVPHAVPAQRNPSESVTAFKGVGPLGQQPEDERSSGLKRFRANDEDDLRSTMDLSSLRNKGR